MIIGKKYIADFTTLIVAVITTIFCLSHIVTHPGEILINVYGDAAKNYFTYLYHAQYGDGIWFEGMNYPYGEHIVFADAQPVLSICFKWLFGFIKPLSLLHLSIGLSFFLAIVFIYKILCRFKVEWYWSLSFAVLITVMSPQVLKLNEHFSLAYLCVVPMLFYYNLAYYQQNNRKYIAFLLGTAFVFTCIHLYFAAIICFWIASYSLIYLVFTTGKLDDKFRHIIPVCIAAILPFIIMKIFLLITDSATDRPVYPWGARWNRTFMKDLYSSFLSPVSSSLKESNIIAEISTGGEGYTYTGIVPILMLAIAAFVSVFLLFRKKRASLYITDKNSVAIWFLIAVAMLIAGTSIIFQKCFTCLDHAAFLKQFRAMGRFSWGYYYIVTITSVVLLFRAFRFIARYSIKPVGHVMMIAAFALWAVEALPYAKWTRDISRDGRTHYKNFFGGGSSSWGGILEDINKSETDFQAILLLPYVHIGTEKVSPNAFISNILVPGFSAAMNLHLPLIDVMMSRSAWSQSFGQQRISGGPYADKPILKNLPSSKPILLLHHTDHPLQPNEKYLLKAAEKVHHHYDCDIYILYPDRLAMLEKANQKAVAVLMLDLKNGDTCIGNNSTWYVEHFDTHRTDYSIYGEGAFGPIESVTKIILDKPLKPAHDSMLYEFSIWSLVSSDDYRIGRYRVILYDSVDNTIAQHIVLAQEANDNRSLWVRASKYFPIPAACSRVAVELIDIIKPSYIAVDELMLRPADALIITKNDEGEVMVNNHVFDH